MIPLSPYTILLILALWAGMLAPGAASAQALAACLDRNRGLATRIDNCRTAAKQGHVEAQVGLGLLYYHGLGVDKDYAEAMRWYRLAAEQGHHNAQVQLGVMYYYGVHYYGLPSDYVRAYMWLSLTASRGHELSRNMLDELKKRLTPEQIAEAERMAREWVEKRKGK